MSTLNRRSGKRDSLKKVFRTSRRQPKKSTIRQFFEASLMLSVGAAFLTALNWLPQQIDLLVIITGSFSALLEGLVEVIKALATLSSGLLLGGLMLFGLILLLGGLWRLVRVVSLLVSESTATRKGRSRIGKLRR